MPSSSVFSNTVGPVVANVPAAVALPDSPYWRFVITTLDTEVLTFLDKLATDRTATFILNGPAVATGAVPSDDPEINIEHTDGEPFLAEGVRCLYGFRNEIQSADSDGNLIRAWIVRYGGIIMQLQDVAQQDNAMTHYTALDPWQLLYSRPLVTYENSSDGNIAGEDGLSFTDTRIDVIIGTLLRNAILFSGDCYIDAGEDYGGTAFYSGEIEVLDQIDINFQQGTSLGEAWDILTNRDDVDIMLTPIYDPENRPGYLCELNVYAQAGAEVDEAIFAWDKPSRSLVGVDRLRDGTQRANVIKMYAGQGGTAVNGQNVPVQEDLTSIATYGEYWAQQFFPGVNVADAVEALAYAQLQLRKNGKDTVTISPAPERSPLPWQEYFLGDRVPVYASDRLRKEIVGYQRIYGIPISIADDATETILQMLTSRQA